MEYDFCLISSWSEQSQRQVLKWGTELEQRGYTVAIISPSSSRLLSSSEIQTFLVTGEEATTDTKSVAEIESQYGIPSLDHLAFTERLYFRFSRAEAVTRARRLASSMGQLFDEHS